MKRLALLVILSASSLASATIISGGICSLVGDFHAQDGVYVLQNSIWSSAGDANMVSDGVTYDPDNSLYTTSIVDRSKVCADSYAMEYTGYLSANANTVSTGGTHSYYNLGESLFRIWVNLDEPGTLFYHSTSVVSDGTYPSSFRGLSVGGASHYFLGAYHGEVLDSVVPLNAGYYEIDVFAESQFNTTGHSQVTTTFEGFDMRVESGQPPITPEPASLVAMGSGLVWLIGRRRRGART